MKMILGLWKLAARLFAVHVQSKFKLRQQVHSDKNNLSHRSVGLDLIRIIACVLVVMAHSPMSNEMTANNSLFLGSWSFFVRPCVPLFIMISGALLLPVEMSTRSFLGRRLNKIIFPTLFWTAVYIILRPKDESLIKTVLTVPFSWQGHPVMWYMYTLIGLYLVAPIISRWLVSSSKRELHFYLLLWSVTLCYPILSLFLHVETGEIGILYYFTGYIGYFVLGYYMKQYGKSISLKRLFIPALLAFISTFAYRISGCRVDTGVVFGYTSIIIALISLFWYVAILRLSHIFESKSACISLIQKTSSLTFGIYLSHISFLKIVWHFTNYINSYPIQTVVSWLLTFALAFVFTYVVSFLPYSRYIIGFQQKSK